MRYWILALLGIVGAALYGVTRGDRERGAAGAVQVTIDMPDSTTSAPLEWTVTVIGSGGGALSNDLYYPSSGSAGPPGSSSALREVER